MTAADFEKVIDYEFKDKGLLQKLMLTLYKVGCRKAKHVFFQNKSNLEFFQKRKIVGENVILLPGSGVNTEKFSYMKYPENEKTNIVFYTSLYFIIPHHRFNVNIFADNCALS